MSRLEIKPENRSQQVLDQIYADAQRRIKASTIGICPVDMALSIISMCTSQSCGKCVPCRIGLAQLGKLMESVLDGEATEDTLRVIEETAEAVRESADCAIGYEAAEIVLKGVRGFRDDFLEHIHRNRCLCSTEAPVPCVAKCPAGVDIPGYIALVQEDRCGDAVRLIRKDNPFPTACAYICEHPCESRCRRALIDDSLNIRVLKRYAVDNAGDVPNPPCAPDTGKSVAVIGGGPSGLTAAYYLRLMGHKVTVLEQRDRLGGMIRYGIPSYRLPRTKLDAEIKSILSTGIEVKTGVSVGNDVSLDEVRKNYDAVYVSIGAHTDNKLGIENENAEGVLSAVQFLRAIGDDIYPDLTGKTVVVMGGGNVAMDCTRSAIRLGAKRVVCAYRRRREDMTALPDEIEGAIAEGAEMAFLSSPVRIEVDGEGKVKAFWVQKQIVGEIDASGRPACKPIDAEPTAIPCDVVIAAVGQAIKAIDGIPTNRGRLQAAADLTVKGLDGVFSGGDCVTGPATVIRAIAAGKTAAANIDNYLGFNHEISVDVDIPAPVLRNKPAHGRINSSEREPAERKNDFEVMEQTISAEFAREEASRCLRCDHFGYGCFKGGRTCKW